MTAMRREGKGARVWRKVPNEQEMFVPTVDGKLGIKAKCCPSCGETKALGQFYYKGISERYDKYGNEQHERICVVCWDERKLSQKRRRNEVPAITIMNFLRDE